MAIKLVTLQRWNRNGSVRRRIIAFGACIVLLLLSLTIFGADISKQPKRIIFGGDSAYPPFESLEEGAPAGFNIDIEAALGELTGAVIEHKLADWPATLHDLETGVVDAVPMFVSEQRRQKFLFTQPFFYVNHGIYAPPGDNKVAYASDLANHTVVVETSYYGYDRISAELPSVKLITAPNTLAALRTLEAGDAEYAVLATISADRLIRMHHLALQQTGPSLWPSPYAFAVRKDNVELQRWLEEAQGLLIASGQYQKIYQRWESRLAPGSTTIEDIAGLLTAMLLVLVVIGSAGYLWSWYLRRAVTARTSQLSSELRRREAAEAKARYISDYDVHTNLPRSHFFMQLADQFFKLMSEKAITRDEVVRTTSAAKTHVKELAVIKLIDFQKIIGTFGYAAYHDIVNQFAQRLESGGFYVSGYLGREVFTVLGDPGAIVEKMTHITAPIVVSGMEYHPQITWGSAYWPSDGDDASELVRRAETALAKSRIEQKRAGTAYHPDLEPSPDDIKLLSDFSRCAGHCLYAEFQPQVDLATGRIVGAEALVRWEHPELGHISPGRFIPLLENSGLISIATVRMLNEAANFSVELRHAGFLCPISVNIAMYDLLGGDLVKTVTSALHNHNAKPTDIKLELTETGTFENSDEVSKVLFELDRLGMTSIVDDFGTGYSSLKYLSAFPVRGVKIDMGFVRDMLQKPRHREIVRSTIALIHNLGKVAVAEGAEDEATIQALRDYGCDLVQGFAISKSLSRSDFRDFLAAYEPLYWLKDSSAAR